MFFLFFNNETKLLCSIGVAPNKFLAKMGSDYKKPMGITIIRLKDVPSILWPISIDDMYGIGKKTAPRLKNIDLLQTEKSEYFKTIPTLLPNNLCSFARLETLFANSFI